MRSATVSKLKATLSQHLARVKAGGPGPSPRAGSCRTCSPRFGQASKGILEDAPPSGPGWGSAEGPPGGTRERPVKFVGRVGDRPKTHPLSAADALQLAAGLLWADGRPAHHDFVCLDQRLREAAQREGFRVLP